jgi:hypothetical protein
MTSTLPVLNEDWLLSRLPADVRDRLSPEMQTMLAIAAADRPWRKHPVDIRFTLPLPFGPFYVTLVAGRERRSPTRRAVEGQGRHLVRFGNVMFVLATVGVFYAALITAALLLTAILE